MCGEVFEMDGKPSHVVIKTSTSRLLRFKVELLQHSVNAASQSCIGSMVNSQRQKLKNVESSSLVALVIQDLLHFLKQ